MKKKVVFLLLAFFLVNNMALGYLGVLGNLTLEEIRNEVVDEDIERNSRKTETWVLDEEDFKNEQVRYKNTSSTEGKDIESTVKPSSLKEEKEMMLKDKK